VQKEFASYAYHLLRAGGNVNHAAELAENTNDQYPRAHRVLKAAVTAGTTTDVSWASSLTDYSGMAQGFVEALRSVSAFDTILPFARRMPLHSQFGVFTAAIGSAVAQGAALPVRKLSIAADVVDPVRLGALVVTTDELFRFAFAEGVAMLQAEMVGAVADVTDQEFGAFLASGAPSSASSGNVRSDLQTALASIAPRGRSKMFAIVGPATASDLATAQTADGLALYPGFTPTGGVIAGVQFVASDTAVEGSPDDMIVVDAHSLALAADLPMLRASKYATIEMDDAPSNSAVTGTAANMVSMFQSNSVALLAERYTGWTKIRSNAAYVVTSPVYAGTVP